MLVDDLTRVAIVENEPAAELAVSLLETEGIWAMWRKTDIASAIWGLSLAAGGPVEILVLAKDVPRAQELLADSD
jgi:hypothetical protein